MSKINVKVWHVSSNERINDDGKEGGMMLVL